jgi:excinuclease ABC subunit B
MIGSAIAILPVSVTFPNSPFRLNQIFPPAGDQPEAIDKLREGIDDGLAYQTLLGVTGSGKTYTLANAIARLGRPALVLAPNKTLAAQLYSEFREFFPENAVEYFVSYYDYYQPEAYVRRATSSSRRTRRSTTTSSRCGSRRRSRCSSGATWSSSARCRRSTASATLGVPRHDPAPAPGREDGAARHPGAAGGDAVRAQRARLPPRHLPRARRRDRLSSRRSTPSTRSGSPSKTTRSTSWRCSIRSPAGYSTRWRASRSTRPATTSRRARPRCGRSRAIKAELRERIKFFQDAGRLVEAQRIEQRTRFDLEMLAELGFCKGIENYSRHLSGRQAGRAAADADRLPAEDALMIIDESHVTIPQLGGMYKGDRSRKENLVEYGFRLPSALDNRPLRFDEFEKVVRQTVFVSATPSEYERRSPRRWWSRWCALRA